MKLLLINPSQRKVGLRSFWDADFIMRTLGVTHSIPLWVPTVAALTPEDVEIKVVDENIEEINFDEKVDLIGIGSFTSHIFRAYEIADEFRKRGKKVVIGGIHASMLPEEAAQHADAVVIGEAENVWKNLVEDFKSGNLRKFYKANGYPCLEDSPIPRFDLTKNSKYATNMIQTSRGCPFDCEFCSVKALLGPKFRLKRIEQVIQEIESCPKYFEIEILGHKLKMERGFFFVDDNIIGNRSFAKRLFEALKPMKLPKWWCQASINVANDLELLSLMKEAGCGRIFIGIESLEEQSLNEMGKRVNKVEEYERYIKTIQSFGISVVGSFILGADGDEESIFEKTVDFINRNNIVFSMINILTPLPGTRLFQSLEAEGRILHKNWEKYDSISVCFKPKNMTPEVLEEGCRWIYQKLYSHGSLVKRVKGFWEGGNIKSEGYEKEFKNMLLTDKIFFIFVVFKLLLSAGLNGVRVGLDLLPKILKGEGDSGMIPLLLFFNDFAFSLPKTELRK